MISTKFINAILKVIVIFFGAILVLIFVFKTPDVSIESLKKKYTDEASRFVMIDGLEIHYKDEGSGIPVLLLHGTSPSLHTWDGWTEKLIKNYRVIRMDLPAFGVTGANENNQYDLNSYNQFLESFLNKLDLEEFILAGNSLGGSISWFYTANHPDQVKQLILLDPAGFQSQKERPLVFRLAEFPLSSLALKHITPKFFIKDNLEQVYYDDSKVTDELIERYYQMILREGSRNAFIERAKLERADNTHLLHLIKTPTLIIWGENDLWIPVEDGKKFKDRIANSRLVVMKETGHVPMEEKPLESVAHAIDFIIQNTPKDTTQTKEN